MLRASLDDGAHDHDATPTKDGLSATEFAVYNGDKGKTEKGSETVAGGDQALESTLRIVKVYAPCGDDLESIDELRVETRGELDTHAGREEHEV